MLKKLSTLLLIIALVLSLTACGKPTPTEVTTSFLDAVKAQDSKTIASVYAEDTWSLFEVSSAKADFSEDHDELDQYFTNDIFPKLLEFDYEIIEERVEEETAEVDVKITTYDMGTAFTNFITEYLTQGISLAFSGADVDYDALANKLFKEEFGKMEKSFTKTVTVSLSKVDGAWIIDKLGDDAPLTDALLGGLITSIEAYNESLDD